jgi:hypothetical protein
MTTMMVEYRLVPIVIPDKREDEPQHHTERGDFNLTSYIEPFGDDMTIINVETGEVIDFTGKHTITIYLFWMGIAIQKHMMIAIDETGEHHDMFDENDADYHSLQIHQSFAGYMDGFESNFPKLRALGWSYLPPSAVVAVQMAEHRAFSQASTRGNHDMEEMYDAADMEVDDTPRASDPLSIQREAKLSPNVSDFMNKMENTLRDKYKENDDDEGRTESD